MNKNDEPKKKEDRWIFYYVLAIVSIAFAINLLMSPSIPSISSIDAPTWLTFWGSYLGGAIGCLPAIAALQHSRREARRQHEENEKSRRLGALPVFACTLNSASLLTGQAESLTTLSGVIHLSQERGLYGQFRSWNPEVYAEHVLSADENEHPTFFELRNIGAGPALNVSLACAPSPAVSIQSIGTGEKSTLTVLIYIPPDAKEDYMVHYDIHILFSDIFGNRYLQIQPLWIKKEKQALAEISTPKQLEL